MLKKTLSLICFATLSFATSTFSQEQFVADKVVAVVGNSAIFYSDLVDMGAQIDKQRKEEGYTLDRDVKNEALERLMLQKLLYNQALIDSVEIQSSNIEMGVEENVQKIIADLGSISAVEKKYEKPIYEIKKDMITQYEEMSYAQSMQQTVQDKIKITPGEVSRYYKSLPKDSLPKIPEQYVYAQITKVPTSTKEAKQRTKETLLGLRERIVNGTRFEVLARMYSIDQSSALRGGEMDPCPAANYVKPFADALIKLKPNQVSEVIETEFGFHIIQLIGQKGDLYHCRHILIKPVFSNVEILETNTTLDSIANMIKSDSISFAEAALLHSDDEYSKQNGGIVSNYEILKAYYPMARANHTSTKISKEELMPTEYRELQNLKIGEISESFKSNDLHGNMLSKVVKLIEIIPSHYPNLENDYLLIEETALADKKDQGFQEWINKTISSMYIRIDTDVDTSLFKNQNWAK